MPIAKEFTIRQEDKPGTLGTLCQALADQNVNILAFQSFPVEKGKSSIHLVLDNPTAGKTVLDRQRMEYTVAEVAQVKLAHRPGELARAASRLGDAGININYGYCGTEPVTNASMLIFGVADGGRQRRSLRWLPLPARRLNTNLAVSCTETLFVWRISYFHSCIAAPSEDSARLNLYLSIRAPTPMRSALLSETSSTRTTLARPLINAWAA